VWTGLAGDSVADLVAHPRYTLRATATRARDGLSVGAGAAPGLPANSGSRLTATMTVPTSGAVTFHISSSGASELWVAQGSGDLGVAALEKAAAVPEAGVGADAPNKWTKYQSQISQARYMEAGKQYTVRVLHKSGVARGGGMEPHLAVSWKYLTSNDE
jgi:hypothetical protein